MSVNFTQNDICDAADAAWKAIDRYAKRHAVCAGCLGAYTLPDMLFHVVKNNIADEHLPGYQALLERVWNAAIAARNGDSFNPHMH